MDFKELSEKTILYLSNMKETLDDVEAFMNKIGLGRNIANFSNSFSSLAICVLND